MKNKNDDDKHEEQVNDDDKHEEQVNDDDKHEETDKNENDNDQHDEQVNEEENEEENENYIIDNAISDFIKMCKFKPTYWYLIQSQTNPEKISLLVNTINNIKIGKFILENVGEFFILFVSDKSINGSV